MFNHFKPHSTILNYIKPTLLLFIVIIHFHCSPGNKKAYEFNEKMVAISRTMQEKGRYIGEELATAVQTHDFSKVDSANHDLLGFVRQQRSALLSEKDIPHSDTLRNAMLEFLSFEERLIDSTFMVFGKMGQHTPGTELQAALKQLNEKIREENKYLQRVHAAQKAFAERNGYKVKSSP
jgi:hypothetical protein